MRRKWFPPTHLQKIFDEKRVSDRHYIKLNSTNNWDIYAAQRISSQKYIDLRVKGSTIIRCPLFRYFVNISVRFLRLSFGVCPEEAHAWNVVKRRSEAQRITHYTYYYNIIKKTIESQRTGNISPSPDERRIEKLLVN